MANFDIQSLALRAIIILMFLDLPVGQELFKFISPEFMSYLGERGVLYTSPHEHVEYNV